MISLNGYSMRVNSFKALMAASVSVSHGVPTGTAVCAAGCI